MSTKRRIARVAIVSSGDGRGMAASVQRGMQANGVHCDLVPYTSWFPSLPGLTMRGAGTARRLVNAGVRLPLEARLVAALARARPDAVLFIKADDVHPWVYPLIRRATGAPIVVFHPDDPFNNGNLVKRGPAHPRSIGQARAADLCLSWSPLIMERLVAAGVRKPRYIAFAADPALHPVPSVSDADRRALGADVAFIGNWDAEREHWMTAIVAACEADGVDLALWGAHGWKRAADPRVQRSWRGRPLFADEMATAVAASRINLNILRLQNKDATNMRTFEIPCAGGFMLHERSAMLGRHFKIGEAVDDFATVDELVAKVKRWLGDDDERERVAAQGHSTALAWTYTHWAGQVLEWTEPLVRG